MTEINLQTVVRAGEKMKIPCYLIDSRTLFFSGKIFEIDKGILRSGQTKMRFYSVKSMFENLLEYCQIWSMATVTSLRFFYESFERGATRNSRETQAHESWVKKNYKPNEFIEKR